MPRAFLLAMTTLFACSRAPALAPAVTPSATATTSQTPQSATPGVFARACETECADDLAWLTVYRDAQGALGLVTVLGSPSSCSAPPLRFLGPDGVERAVIPLVPVVPGSPEDRHFDEIRKTQTANLQKAETMLCRSVKH
jgi:hypothetical protein